MNKAKLLQSILELHKTVKDGNMEKMYRCANELNALFEIEVPEPLEGFDAALMRFKMAEAMVAFHMAVGEQSQAGTLRNRITAHYQAVRKSKDYSVSQKHELKEIQRRIKVIVPSQRCVATKLDKNAEEYKRSAFIIRSLDWFSELHGMLPLEGLGYLKPFNVSTFLSTLPLNMPKAQVVEEMWPMKLAYDQNKADIKALGENNDDTGSKELNTLQIEFRKLLHAFRYDSNDTRLVSLLTDDRNSNYLYLPQALVGGYMEHLRSVSSASDFVRSVWAYYLALMKVGTQHPGFLLFDEPCQHSINETDLKTLFERCTEIDRQIILFCSSEPKTEETVNAEKGDKGSVKTNIQKLVKDLDGDKYYLYQMKAGEKAIAKLD